MSSRPNQYFSYGKTNLNCSPTHYAALAVLHCTPFLFTLDQQAKVYCKVRSLVINTSFHTVWSV